MKIRADIFCARCGHIPVCDRTFKFAEKIGSRHEGLTRVELNADMQLEGVRRIAVVRCVSH